MSGSVDGTIVAERTIPINRIQRLIQLADGSGIYTLLDAQGHIERSIPVEASALPRWIAAFARPFLGKPV